MSKKGVQRDTAVLEKPDSRGFRVGLVFWVLGFGFRVHSQPLFFSGRSPESERHVEGTF